MKKTILTVSLAVAMGSVYAAGPEHGAEYDIEQNDVVFLNTDGNVYQTEEVNLDMRGNRSINIGTLQEDFMRTAGDMSGQLNNLVLNAQVNTGDNTANVNIQGLESNVDANTDRDLSSASVSATALGSNMSLNVAADKTVSTRTTTDTQLDVGAINHETRHLSLASVQANSGDNTASVSAASLIKTKASGSAYGSLTSGAVSASAIGNNVSINIGGIVD